MNAEKVVTLEISGKIIEILEVKSGQSANGEWRKQEYVLETEAQYPKKVCFMAWGDKIDQFNIQKGETVAVSIDLESREYNGRWYTDVKAWKVSRDGAETGNQPPFDDRDRYAPPSVDSSPIGNDDIPF